jgi:hypothetical protein
MHQHVQQAPQTPASTATPNSTIAVKARHLNRSEAPGAPIHRGITAMSGIPHSPKQNKADPPLREG